MQRFLDYFVPEKYQLNLVIEKDKKKIGGTVKIFGEAKAEKVKFHAVSLEIESAKVGGAEAKFEVQDDVLIISGVSKGEVEIEIKYCGSLNENMQGAYLSTYEYNGETETIVATQFESHYAREAFPCIDEPAAKAVYELSLAIPEGSEDLVLANTPEKSSEVVDGCKVITFEPTPRMSTYLLAWVIGKFHGKTIKNAHGVEISTYVALNQEVDSVDFANEIAAKSLEFYDDNFGVPYPLPRLVQVGLPDFEAGAMENWGLVTYRESMLIAGKNATLGTKKGIALTVSHELSHQWFGDLVTMAWWDDLWLNESFASVMEYFATDYIHPEYKIFEGFFTGDALSALKRDAYLDVQSVHQDVEDPAEIATLFDPSIVYSKGARLMLMLIRAMGWDNFLKGICDYFRKHQYQNTVGDDLWAALNPYAKFDVKDLMHNFIDRPGYPVVTKNEGGISQRRFVFDGEMVKSDWPIPKIRDDMSGHYIVQLSEKEFEEKLANFKKLGLEEKLRLLIDKSLLVKTELDSSATLLPLMMKFQHEESAAVWNIILTQISYLKIFFDYNSNEENLFRKFVGELVKPKLAEIGLFTRGGDDENILRLRAILLALDYFALARENLNALSSKFNPDLDKLDPEIREDILDAKIYVEPAIFDDYLQMYQEIPDPELKFELMLAMTLSVDEKNVKKMLELLERPEVIKPQDQFSFFIYLYRNPVARERAFLWLTTHWDYVSKLAGDKSLDNYPRYIANSVRTDKEAEAYKAFFEPKKNEPAMKRAIMIGLKEIQANLKLISDDREAIYKELK